MIHLHVRPPGNRNHTSGGCSDWEDGGGGIIADTKGAEKILLASDRKEDRDAMLVGLRYL